MPRAKASFFLYVDQIEENPFISAFHRDSVPSDHFSFSRPTTAYRCGVRKSVAGRRRKDQERDRTAEDIPAVVTGSLLSPLGKLPKEKQKRWQIAPPRSGSPGIIGNIVGIQCRARARVSYDELFFSSLLIQTKARQFSSLSRAG